ncbi:MAG: class IV adenylate cyclase [Phycisphaerales bacterium]|nr:class IV adenylate cyclase [Phycisphaerales bacterium]
MKAELREPHLAPAIVRALGAVHIIDLDQTDTYYNIPCGRLKKREAPGEPTEYIFYDRPDRAAPKLSHFVIYSEAQARDRFGAAPLPVRIVVRKRRSLYMLENVRIHLDEVEDLGHFVELEAMLTRGTPLSMCREAIARVRTALGPVIGELIDCGYADLLQRASA